MLHDTSACVSYKSLPASLRSFHIVSSLLLGLNSNCDLGVIILVTCWQLNDVCTLTKPGSEVRRSLMLAECKASIETAKTLMSTLLLQLLKLPCTLLEHTCAPQAN